MTPNRRDGERIERKRMVKEQEEVVEENEEEATAMAAWTEHGPVPCGFR